MSPFLKLFDMDYKEGDVILLKDDRDFLHPCWVSQMDVYKGQVVTIGKWNISSFTLTEEDYDRFGHRDYNWQFLYDDIIGYASEEEIGKARIRREEREREREEELKSMIYKRDDLYKIASEIFGEERVDVTESDGNISLIIHFPEIIITNSKEHVHRIKDMYVRIMIHNLRLDNLYKADMSFEGMRRTLSLTEAATVYVHSHLPSNIGGWSTFCTGSSTFGIVLSNLKTTLKEEDWYMLLYSLENYLSWESLEGGPYRKISEIGSNYTVSIVSLKRELGKFIHLIPKNAFYYSNGILSITSTPVLYDFFNKHSSIRKLINNNNEEDRIYRENYANDTSILFTFKGNKIKYSIYIEEQNDAQISEGLVDKYIQIINKSCKEFAKTYQYDILRQHSKIGENRINIEANNCNNREIKETDRLPA